MNKQEMQKFIEACTKFNVQDDITVMMPDTNGKQYFFAAKELKVEGVSVKGVMRSSTGSPISKFTSIFNNERSIKALTYEKLMASYRPGSKIIFALDGLIVQISPAVLMTRLTLAKGMILFLSGQPVQLGADLLEQIKKHQLEGEVLFRASGVQLAEDEDDGELTAGLLESLFKAATGK